LKSFRKRPSAFDLARPAGGLRGGARLPLSDIKDLFCYRGPDTILTGGPGSTGWASLGQGGDRLSGQCPKGQADVNGAVTLYDDATGELEALVDFHLVTKWKTAGDSLLAASKLARKSSRNFLLVGAGTVARSMVEAYSSLWPDGALYRLEPDPGRRPRAWACRWPMILRQR
jgi:ornithine cyclodeaminase